MSRRTMVIIAAALALLVAVYATFDAQMGGRVTANLLNNCARMNDAEAKTYALERLEDTLARSRPSMMIWSIEDLSAARMEVSRPLSGTEFASTEVMFVRSDNRELLVMRIYPECEIDYFPKGVP